MIAETDPKKIADKLCEFARTNFVAEGQEFDENSPLSQAGIDSFALVELLLFCERNIGVRVPDSHLTGANLTSMSTLAACIAELARAKSQSLAAIFLGSVSRVIVIQLF